MNVQDELITVAAKIEVDQDELQEKLQSTTKEAHKLKEEIDRVEKAMGVLALRGEKNSEIYDELNDLSKKLRWQQKELREESQLYSCDLLSDSLPFLYKSSIPYAREISRSGYGITAAYGQPSPCCKADKILKNFPLRTLRFTRAS